LIGEASETQTGDSSVYANPLKSLASKAGDFLRYSPALENVGYSESVLPENAPSALPSFPLYTAQMLDFSAATSNAENSLVFEGGRGKGAENKPSPHFDPINPFVTGMADDNSAAVFSDFGAAHDYSGTRNPLAL
jgi:hypothetical protein